MSTLEARDNLDKKREVPTDFRLANGIDIWLETSQNKGKPDFNNTCITHVFIFNIDGKIPFNHSSSEGQKVDRFPYQNCDFLHLWASLYVRMKTSYG